MDPGVVLARSVRNGRIQAVHAGHAVLLDAEGQILEAWGDPATATYWRSCGKPLQALPFAKQMDGLGLDDASLAVACGSHDAEPVHVHEARRILAAARLGEAALKCAAHDVDEAAAGPRPPGGWTALHNNCSGKHAAMLAVCVARGWPTATYLDPDHPLQQEIHALIQRCSGEEAPVGVDGCGLPTYWTSLAGLARAMQRLRDEPDGPRVLDAMSRHARLVGGTGRQDTRILEATSGRVVAKIGALGVHVAVERDTRHALAVKVSDGASQPRDAVTVALMGRVGWLSDSEAKALQDLREPVLRNHAGRVVGYLEPVV